MAEDVQLDVIINLFDDVADLCRAALVNAGYPVDRFESSDDIVFKYYRVQHPSHTG